MAEAPDNRVAALEAELAAARAELQAFTATVSHDLRAPLRHIVSYAQLVQEDAGPGLSTEVRQFLATITDSARHMGLMLDGLAGLARVGARPLDLCAVSLQELVPQVCAELALTYPPGRVEWRVAPDLPVVHADPTLLRQALTQVLDNALKFSAGRERAVIAIDAAVAPDRHQVVLQVRDNGVGYNPALQDKLFGVFARLHGAQQFAGLGLGLALTRTIMQRMHGTVEIAATQDVGCCVSLGLPTPPSEPTGD